MSGEDEPVGREVAYRIFAAEYDDATLSHTESDDDRAPNYVVTPTGARINRLFAVGTLTEVSRVNEEMVRARVVDPTGAFVVYAGQYQPEALAFLESAEPPEFVAVTGKARTFEPDDGDRIYTSVRPESIAVVDADTRDRWVVTTAERTDDRIETIAAAATEEARDDELATLLADRGVETGLASGIPLAFAHYGTTPDYLGALSDLATDAVRVIAGDLEEVPPFEIAPSGEGETEIGYADLAREFDGGATGTPESTPAPDEPTTAGEPTETSESGEPDASGTSAEAAEETAAETDIGDVEPDDEGEATDPAPEETATESTESEPEAATAEADDLEVAELADDPEPAAGEKPEPASDEPADAGSELEPDTGESEPATVTESGAGIDADADAGEEASADLEESVEGDAGMYEMDDEERAEIEDEFGAEFTTGTDVEDAGEADIESPESGDGEGADGETDELGEFDSGGEEFSAGEPEPEPGDGADDSDEDGRADAESEPEGAEEGEDVDLEAYAVETMQEMDDGDGADRERVVERVASETGAEGEAVESAIDEALMSGRCYEPEDGTLKAI